MTKVNTTKAKTAIATAKATPLQTIEDALTKNMATMAQAMPAHMKPERVLRVVISLLKTNPSLQDCSPFSVMGAVFQMAQLGLEPIDGQAYIIPYNSKKGKQAQFQIGYKGLVSLFYRHEKSGSLDWGIVCENDQFTFDKGKGILSHRINLKEERGDPYAYWVKAKLSNNAEIVEAMSKIEVLKHAKHHSRAFGSGPWQTDFDAMALKTALKKLMKLLPKSIEIQRALDMDETTKTRIEPDMADVPDETPWGESEPVEAEVVEVGNPTPPAPNGAGSGKPHEAKGTPDDVLNMDDYRTDGDGVLVHKVTGKPA